MVFLVIPEGLYRGSNVPQEEPGFPLRSAAGMTFYEVVPILKPLKPLIRPKKRLVVYFFWLLLYRKKYLVYSIFYFLRSGRGSAW